MRSALIRPQSRPRGSGLAWYDTCFGSMRSSVQIRSTPPYLCSAGPRGRRLHIKPVVRSTTLFPASACIIYRNELAHLFQSKIQEGEKGARGKVMQEALCGWRASRWVSRSSSGCSPGDVRSDLTPRWRPVDGRPRLRDALGGNGRCCVWNP